MIRSLTTFGKLNIVLAILFILSGIGIFFYATDTDYSYASISFILLGIVCFFLAQTMKKEDK